MIFFRIFRIFIILFIIWLAGFSWFIGRIALVEPEIHEKADAVIVLTGARGRIDIGLELLSKQHADHLFVSGVGQNAVLSDLSKYLVSFTPDQVEFLKDYISLGHLANSTQENALETFQWVKKHNYKKIFLVTSSYHMQRSLLLFKQLMPDVTITPYPLVSAPTSFKLLFLEYNKYLLCRLNLNKL